MDITTETVLSEQISSLNQEVLKLKSKPDEYILCAAIWYKDFEMPKNANQVKNIDKGVVLCGHRHGHIISQMIAITGKRTCTFGENATGESVQGFLTNKNRFLNRKEAHKLFVENGGKPEFKDELYSEDLY